MAVNENSSDILHSINAKEFLSMVEKNLASKWAKEKPSPKHAAVSSSPESRPVPKDVSPASSRGSPSTSREGEMGEKRITSPEKGRRDVSPSASGSGTATPKSNPSRHRQDMIVRFVQLAKEVEKELKHPAHSKHKHVEKKTSSSSLKRGSSSFSSSGRDGSQTSTLEKRSCSKEAIYDQYSELAKEAKNGAENNVLIWRKGKKKQSPSASPYDEAVYVYQTLTPVSSKVATRPQLSVAERPESPEEKGGKTPPVNQQRSSADQSKSLPSQVLRARIRTFVDTSGSEIVVSDTAKGLTGRQACPCCDRKFHPARLPIHVRICAKVFGKKRPVFDSKSKRIEGIDSPLLHAMTSEVHLKHASNWRQTHEALIAAIQHGRMVAQQLNQGKKLSEIPPPPVDPHEDYITCKYCGRRFHPEVAKRHVPKCKHIVSNKPVAPGSKPPWKLIF